MMLSLVLGSQTFTPSAWSAAAQPLTPSSFTTGDFSQNIIQQLQTGADPGQLATMLDQSPLPGIGASGTNVMSPQQLTGMLGTIGPLVQNGTMDPASAAQLVNLVGAGVLPPQITGALGAIGNLGNIPGNAQGVAALLNPSTLAQIAGLPAGQQGFALEQVLALGIDGGTAGLGQGGIQQLAGAAQQLPAVLAALQSGGGDIMATLQNLLGTAGGLTSLLGGILGGTTTPTGGGTGAGTGRTKDKGNYEIKNKIGEEHTDNVPGPCGGPCSKHETAIPEHHNQIRKHTHQEFEKHRAWIVNEFWKEHVLPAMMLMAEQLTAVGIQQVEMIGAMLDAKHQLETQRLMQQLTAQAHKDYQPSEGMCTFGTTVRNLAASERKSDLVQIGVAERMMQRQTMSGDVISSEAGDTDIRSRMHKFIEVYCDRADNLNGLDQVCENTTGPVERRNIDVDYTRNIESRLTLDMDFAEPAEDGAPDTDKEDVFALAANLYSHNTAPLIEPEKLGKRDGRVLMGGAQQYLKLRSIYAKRSVAQNSFAALTSMRAAGLKGEDGGTPTDSAAPYIKALIKELGVQDPDDIEKLLGENPSYFAQMEVLTKKIYQNPTFYTELYDKPVNVERKGAAIQAISLMQDRDLYNSLLRSEAVLSVLLETMLTREQERIISTGAPLEPELQ